MEQKKFLRVKNDMVTSTPRPFSGGSATILTAKDSYEEMGSNYPQTFSVQLSIPFEERISFLIRGQSEVATPFGQNAIEMRFSGYADPYLAAPISVFDTKFNAISGVHSLDPDRDTSPFNLGLDIYSFNTDVGGGDHGFMYVSLKLIVFIGAWTGDTTLLRAT